MPSIATLDEKAVAVQKDVYRSRKPKVLFLDIETFPVIGYTWGLHEVDVVEVIEDFAICCIGMKWLDESGVHVFALPDYPGYAPGSRNDAELMGTIHEYLSKADMVCAHNGDQFDIKKINARLIVNGYPPVSPYKQIDTLKIARKYFGFDSNRLDALGRQLGVGRKVKHEGFDMWKGCMAGDARSWSLMKKYNKQDVLLLENVYLQFRGWNSAHPNVGFFTRRPCCKHCGNEKINARGQEPNRGGWRRRYFCENCFGWTYGEWTPQKDGLYV